MNTQQNVKSKKNEIFLKLDFANFFMNWRKKVLQSMRKNIIVKNLRRN